MMLLDVLLGRRLANREQEGRKIGWFAGVPAMGLDGLGSSSYGPEAALTILMPLGAASFTWIGWVLAPIVGLLAILYLSYRQTILAYPSNGGAYTVARENLGTGASLLAAAALMIDYVLNVAVGISAGVGALTSSVPTLAKAGQAVGLWLLLRAFAAGCTAMTGVEAVSNGVSAFKEPVVREAHRTLTVICLALGLLLAGIAAVAQGYCLGAMDQAKPGYQSVLSQLAAAIAGHGALYYIAMASVLSVLCLSANTSFVGFPRICRLVALDGYLPRSFAVAGRRLVFSVGVAFLSVTAGGLLIAFGGITDRLIPLFAIGAFLTFTLSQIGMVVHWRRHEGGNAGRLTINAIGAVTTSVALAIILAAKFLEGAWFVVLAVPATIALLYAAHQYYVRLAERLAPTEAFRVDETDPPTVLIAYAERNRMTDRALRFAMSLSGDVLAVHLLRLGGPEQKEDVRAIQEQFDVDVVAPITAAGLTPPRLVIVPAPYREIHGPLLELVDRIDADTPGRSVAILVPELVLRHWWQRLLHRDQATRLRKQLLAHAGPRLMVMTSPWRL